MFVNLRKYVFVSCLTCAFLSAIMLLPKISEGGAGLIKIRNAFLVELGESGDFDWTPNSVPQSYKLETRNGADIFKNAVNKIENNSGDSRDEWDRSLLLAEELLSYPKRSGGSIKKDSATSYKLIVENGRGYCADYTQVFNALAITSGISIREWGFSDSEFGGGHAFSEIYSSDIKKWIFVDVFNSFYVVNDLGVPLSVNEFRSMLQAGASDKVNVKKIVPGRFGFKDEQQALSYYSDAIGQYYMWWGNNIFSYESNSIIKLFSFSRHAEQLAAILLRVHPVMKVVPEGVSLDDLNSVRRTFIATLALCISLLFLVLFFAVWAFRAVRGR